MSANDHAFAHDLAENVTETLRGYRMAQTTERALQDSIAEVLHHRGFSFQREARLSARDRPDFLITPGICLEVKTQGPASEVRRQLERYAESPDVAVVLLVTTNPLHEIMPDMMAGKPVMVLCLGGAFL